MTDVPNCAVLVCESCVHFLANIIFVFVELTKSIILDALDFVSLSLQLILKFINKVLLLLLSLFSFILYSFFNFTSVFSQILQVFCFKISKFCVHSFVDGIKLVV
jgi:hypothetical protein